MKKIAAILLIIVLFFNWYGYRIVAGMMEKKADIALDNRLDNNQYDESQLIELRVALDVPYQNNQSEFERHYGEMQIDGKYYTYVKRKIENGFLILKCIPNDGKQRIKAAGNDFFKMANGLDQNHQQDKKGNTSFAKNFWSEYDDQLNSFDIDPSSDAIHTRFIHNSISLYNSNRSTPERPPDHSLYLLS